MMNYKIYNTFNAWPRVEEGKLWISRFNIYSGIYLKTSDISICTDLSKLPEPIANNINPDYLILSHLSLDHFDMGQILSRISNKTKIFSSPQCFKRLYQTLKCANLEKNLFLVTRDYVYIDDIISIHFYESIHGDYLEPITFKITLIKSRVSIYHGVDSLKLTSYEKIKADGQIDIGIFPMSIAPMVSEKSFEELVEETEVNLAITNHVLSEILNNYVTNDNKIILLDWNESCLIKINDKTSDLSFSQSRIERTLSQIHIENHKRILDVLNCINSKGFKIEYKGLLASSIIAISNPKIFKKMLLEKILKKINEYFEKRSKHDNKKQILFAAAIWAIGNYYSVSPTEKFNNIEIYNEILRRNDQYLNYWLCESLCQIGKGNQYNYNLANRIFERYKEGKVWEEVLNRRVFAWCKYHLLENIPNGMSIDLEYYSNLFFEFLDDDNPDVRLIGMMGLELLIKTKDSTSSKIVDKIVRSAEKMLGDEEFELIESSLNTFLAIMNKCPAEKERIKKLVKENTLVSKHDNWYVQHKYREIINE